MSDTGEGINVTNLREKMIARLIYYNKSYLIDGTRDRMLEAVDHVIFMLDAFDIVYVSEEIYDAFYNIIAIYTKPLSLGVDFKIAVENVIMKLIDKM